MADEFAPLEPGQRRLRIVNFDQDPLQVVVPEWWYQDQLKQGRDIEDMVYTWLRQHPESKHGA